MDVKSINAMRGKTSQNEMKMIWIFFSKACESEKHESNELCSPLSYAAIYGTIHFAVTAEKLAAEESGVVKLQLDAL